MVDEDGPVNRRTTEGHAITLFLGRTPTQQIYDPLHSFSLICLQDISIAHTHFHPPLINCFLCNNCNSFPARPSPSPKGEGDFASFLDSMTASHHVAVAKDVLHMYLTYTSPVICS